MNLYIGRRFGGVAIDDAAKTEYEQGHEICGFKPGARARDPSEMAWPPRGAVVFGALPAIEVEPAAVPRT